MESKASNSYNQKMLEFTDAELVDELMERFDDIIIGARKILNRSKNPSVEKRRWWKGDYDACVGLMMGAAQDCLHKNWGVKEEDIDPV